MELPENPLGLMRWVVFAQRRAADDWVRDRGLTTEQGRVLGFLVERPGVIQREITDRTRTSAASVSSLLQGLERRGLVERRTEGGDERSKRVYATPAGAELVSGFDVAMQEADEVILAPLSPAEQETLGRLLHTVAVALREPTRT